MKYPHIFICVPMINYAWSGIYHNQVGTHEFIDFCRRINAEPMIVANMESEGLKFWSHPRKGGMRLGTAAEAAAWVDYCNNSENPERIANGAEEPFGVKYWQVNAIMIPTPIRAGTPYLQPVGAVMSLFGKHRGKHGYQAFSLLQTVHDSRVGA